MKHDELVRRAKAILAEAYDEAAYMVAEYLEKHPSESLKALCLEIDPDNWNALRNRVQRAQTKINANADAASTSARALSDSRVRHARSALREADPGQIADIMRDLPAGRRADIVRAAVPPPGRSTSPNRGPSFIDLIVRITSALIEMEAMVAGWQNLAAVPPEFSRDSFNDVATKVLRIQDRFDVLAEAIENDDADEFMKIVRAFHLTTDVH